MCNFDSVAGKSLDSQSTAINEQRDTAARSKWSPKQDGFVAHLMRPKIKKGGFSFAVYSIPSHADDV